MNYGTDSTIVGYLKNSSGKAIKSKVVKITINGQTWSKTTDSNGKISLKIPILDPIFTLLNLVLQVIIVILLLVI